MAINRSRFTSLALLLGLLTSGGGISCTTAYAQQWPPSYERPIEPMQFRWLDVALVDDVGRSFEYTRHRGRYYVAGEEEQSYSIELHNRTPTRVEVVVTVDGRDVVSGALGD